MTTNTQGEGTYNYTCNKPGCYYCESKRPYVYNSPVVVTNSNMEIVRSNWDILSLQDIAGLISMSKSHCSKLGSIMGLPPKTRIRVKYQVAKITPRKAALSTSWW